VCFFNDKSGWTWYERLGSGDAVGGDSASWRRLLGYKLSDGVWWSIDWREATAGRIDIGEDRLAGSENRTAASRACGRFGCGAGCCLAAPTVPFTECPAVGADTSCGLLIDITDSGVAVLQDPSQGPYDGSDDTLVGVLNQSSKSIGHLALASNTPIFAFDGDGICSGFYGLIAGCPSGQTGYEGPGTSFIEISSEFSSGGG
jgi:hypothetical protein